MAVLVVILIASFAMVVWAAPGRECEFTYYSDASKTTVVGWKGEYCNGAQWWGYSTAYYDVECFGECPGGGGCPLDPPDCGGIPG